VVDDYHGSEPYRPPEALGGLNIDQKMQARIADAAMYVAAQLGIIARKTIEIEAHLAKIAAHFPSSDGRSDGK
jgi:hypothetical protein